MNTDKPQTSEDIDPSSDETVRPRYVVGIDLGTTNSALCYIDSQQADGGIHTFQIPQVVAAGQVERHETLPSFCYEALSEEQAVGAIRLPWTKESPAQTVGMFARDHGRTIPGRMIESAKSWLCHNGVDRRAALLPWHGAADVKRMSPVEASASYLRHLREAWNADHPEFPLEKQDVVLTIPASFDEVARELTVAAARLAGLPRIVLLEEPQAAFYSWVDAHRDNWEDIVTPGQKILVCDIGGGTTDFSLIHVRSGHDGRLQFHRVAVGDHLLLGGDNLDLALAHHVEEKLTRGQRLDARQWSMLIPACRHAKEILLGDNPPASHTIVIAGSGSKLIGGSLQAELTRDEVVSIFLNGFLPTVSLDEKPKKRQSGFQEFGLPYASDPAMTRYLAAFLTQHTQTPLSAEAGEKAAATPDKEQIPFSTESGEKVAATPDEKQIPFSTESGEKVAERPDEGANSHAANHSASTSNARPDIVLFNGGFFASPLLRQRLIESLEQWFQPEQPGWTPTVLRNDRLDLAVARGAAYFGMVRRGIGVRIVAGLARTYYVGIEQQDGTRAALCLVAAGTESTATPIRIDRTFQVRTAEPVEFPILVSGTRLSDQPGQIIPFDPEQLTSLPPIRTVLTARKRGDEAIVSARLTASLTEIGTLELWCEQTDGSRRWQLQFDVRSATETDRIAHEGRAEQAGIVDDETIQQSLSVLRSVFGTQGTVKPDDVMKLLAETLGVARNDWPPSLLRALWHELLDLQDGRKKSPQHEARWLNLAGFCLRPGFGMAADDWRVEETWRATNGRLIHATPASLAELRTLCRRISGGLTAGRQNQIASSVMPAIRQRFRQAQTGRGKAAPYASGNHEAAEIWRMLGSLELLDLPLRTELGDMIVDLLNRAAFEPVHNAMMWALGRIGGRVPVYGLLNLVLPISKVSEWIDVLLRTSDVSSKPVQLTLMQLSRRTGDRFRDLDDSLRNRIVQKLEQTDASQHLLKLILEGGSLDSEEAGMILGESLPAGLRLG